MIDNIIPIKSKYLKSKSSLFSNPKSNFKNNALNIAINMNMGNEKISNAFYDFFIT